MTRLNRRRTWTQWLKRRTERIVYALFKTLFGTVRRSEKLFPEQLTRVLILRADKLGDMVLTTAVLNYFKAINPAVEIDVIASEANAALLNGDARVRRVVVLRPAIGAWLKVFRLRQRRYDLVLSLIHNSPVREGLLAGLVATRDTQKVSRQHKAYYRAFFNKMVRPPSRLTHTVEQLVFIASQTVHSDVEALHCEPSLPYKQMESVTNFLREATGGQPFIILNLSAGHAARRWTKAGYIEVVRYVAESRDGRKLGMQSGEGLRSVLLCTAADVNFAQEILGETGSLTALFPATTDLRPVFDLLSRSLLVLTPDTAIVHLAAAFKRPVIDLYGHHDSTTPAEWLPYRVPFRLVQPPEGQATSGISAGAVIAALDNLLPECLAAPSIAVSQKPF